MSGKFDSRRDELLYTMSVDGWAIASDGNVEAPTGWFAYMTNTPAEIAEIKQAFPDFSDVPDAEIVGSFYLSEDSNGFFTVTESTKSGVVEAFNADVEAFNAWSDSDA
jgi:hypothetical protein